MHNSRLKVNTWQAFCEKILSETKSDSSITPPQIDDNTAFIRFLKSNGIACLLLDTLEYQDKTAMLPQIIIDQLKSFRRVASLNELCNKRQLQKTITLLGHNKIDCLILKGSALAYSLYTQPYFRTRGDSDILIRPQDKDTVDGLLVEGGYEKSIGVSGSLISHQNTYVITDNTISYYYDIHWKISNRNAFADLFDFDELNSNREKIAGLGENAYRLSNIDALLHAIVHYYGHFPGDRERLIWIYDLHLLCSRLDQSQWEIFVDKSTQKKLDPLVIKALLLSQATFNTPLPDQVLQNLRQSPVRLNKIEQQRLSATRWSRFAQFKSDWAALSFAERCLLIKEYVLPPSEFILEQNRSNNRLLLPYFYVKRLLIGGIKVIKNSRTE